MIKYEPNSSYLFDCQIKVDGVKATNVEKKFKELLTNLIKESNPSFVTLSNECSDKKETTVKIYRLLEELEHLKHGEIIHFGRIPPLWRRQLEKEMEEKEELDKKRVEALDDCIIICIKKGEELSAIIVDRRGIYSISKNPPE
jgi:hypothetical protein